MLDLPFILEVLSVIFGVAYVALAAKRNIWCWLFGILGSAVSIFLFWHYSKLYAEAILSVYYVVTGVIGWVEWNKPKRERKVLKVPYVNHALLIGLGIVLSFGLYFLLGSILKDATRPMLDSFTTMFSFLATWITIKRWLSCWLYWIIIDAFTSIMYWNSDLNIYAGLMLAYTVLAAYAYFEWKKEYLKS